MKFSEIAREVISLAAAIQDYWEIVLPKRHPDYPFVHAGEKSGPPPSEEKKLKKFLASLSDEDVYKLMTITYLGRGDFGTANLVGDYEALRKAFKTPASAASQMMGKPPLADYLTDGLAELQRSGIDVDHLTFSPVDSNT